MTETGIWNQKEADLYHKSSPKLAKFLASYLDIKLPVYDFGCGQGFYIGEMASLGFNCAGVEGFKLNNFLHHNIFIHDLTKPWRFPRWGSVISFETWEHLPAEFEEIFIDNITHNCYKKLIVSCATPGQPGVGHINCRDHNYVIDKIVRQGFEFMQSDTIIIRQHVDKECDWLERNLLVFDRA